MALVDLDDLRSEIRYHGDPQDLYVALAELLVERPAWHADAACREHPELSWFPAQGEVPDKVMAVCARCLVRTECESAGRGEQGVWGGLEHEGDPDDAGLPRGGCTHCGAPVPGRQRHCLGCRRYRSKMGRLPGPDTLARRSAPKQRVVRSAVRPCIRCGRSTGGDVVCQSCEQAHQDARRAADEF